MKRGSFRKKARPVIREAKRTKPLVPNALGKSSVRKGPIMSEAHLDRIRDMECIVTGAVMSSGPPWHISRVVAHHIRGMFPKRTMGKRITDFLAVPLLSEQHDDYPGSLHKHGNEAGWWKLKGIDPLAWLEKMLPKMYPGGHEGVTQALAKIAALRTPGSKL